MKDLHFYYVVKISRRTGRRQIIAKYVSLEIAQHLVRCYPDSLDSMVVYYSNKS